MDEFRVIFFDCKSYDIQSFESKSSKYSLHLKFFKDRLTIDSVPLAEGAQAVCVFVNDKVNASVIEALAKLGVRLIALRCAGYNNVDLGAAKNYNVKVIRVPAYSPHAVAEHAAALLLALNRKIHRAYSRTREGNFSIQGLTGFDLNGKTVGVVGTGRIGKIFIQIMLGFGLKVLAHDLYRDNQLLSTPNVTYCDLSQLYAESDIISLHCPLTHESHHMICTKVIDQMKTGVILLNTSRGQLICSADLIQGLKSGRIGGAGLDVYEEEDKCFFEDLSGSFIEDDKLARLLMFPNVIVTSHQAFFTKEALENIAETTLTGIQSYLCSNKLLNEVV